MPPQKARRATAQRAFADVALPQNKHSSIPQVCVTTEGAWTDGFLRSSVSPLTGQVRVRQGGMGPPEDRSRDLGGRLTSLGAHAHRARALTTGTTTCAITA